MTESELPADDAPRLAQLREEIATIEARIAADSAEITSLRAGLDARRSEMDRLLAGDASPPAARQDSTDSDDDDLFDDVPV